MKSSNYHFDVANTEYSYGGQAGASDQALIEDELKRFFEQQLDEGGELYLQLLVSDLAHRIARRLIHRDSEREASY